MIEDRAPAYVLITRPKEDAATILLQLKKRNLQPLLEPLLSIKMKPGKRPDLTGVQALLFTSSNGVRAFSARDGDKSLPAYAVGDATARMARENGFSAVTSASGDLAALFNVLKRRCSPEDGAFFHAAATHEATHKAGGLGARLREAGFEYRREILYTAQKARNLSRKCINAFQGAEIGHALFFSPRTAQSFVSLASKAGIADMSKNVVALCLSDAVRREAGVLSWRAEIVADAPTQAALLAALDGTL